MIFYCRKNNIAQEGTAILEFAIILPFLLLIVFGIIEFGLMFYNQQVITNASREGARAGIVAPTNSTTPRLPAAGMTCAPNGSPQPSIECVVNNYCLNHLITFGNNSNPTTTVNGYNNFPTFGSILTVKVDYNYSYLVISKFLTSLGATQNIHAETSMGYE